MLRASPAVFIGPLVMGCGLVTLMCGSYSQEQLPHASAPSDASRADTSTARAPDGATADADASGLSDASETGTTAPCPNLDGTWVFSGTCGGDTACMVTQNGCAIAISCGPDRSLAGNVAATSVSFKGTVVGMPATCAGGPFGADAGKGIFPGACVIGGNNCTFTATQSD
jgi:hypothetical protein